MWQQRQGAGRPVALKGWHEQPSAAGRGSPTLHRDVLAPGPEPGETRWGLAGWTCITSVMTSYEHN